MAVATTAIQTAKPACWFAGANSRYGFTGLFDTVFDPDAFDHIYIVTGGPGTGKSRLMRHVSDYVRQRGAGVTYYYCSSDPSSLDGVVLQNGAARVGILDGTPPHGRIPRYPGTRETLVDLGAFWDKKALSKQKDAIRRAETEKQAAYRRAYAGLALAGTIREERRHTLREAFLREKAEKAAERLLRRFSPKRGSVQTRFAEAYGMQGHAALPTAREQAERVVGILDAHGLSELWFPLFAEKAAASGAGFIRIACALDPAIPAGILFSSPKIAVLPVCRKEDALAFCVNLQRFLDKDRYRAVRGRLRELDRAADAEFAYAESALAEAGIAHFRLEKTYAAAMNFSVKETYTDCLSRTVAEELSLTSPIN